MGGVRVVGQELARAYGAMLWCGQPGSRMRGGAVGRATPSEQGDGIYADLDAVLAMPVRGAKRLRKLLDEQRDAAERSRKLARIVTDIPLECAVERLQWPGCPPADADSLLRETGLGTGAISRLLDACASAVAA